MRREESMKRFYVAALLVLLSTPAFAGNSLSFMGGRRRDQSEAARECGSRSCASSSRDRSRYDDEQDDDDRSRDDRRINDTRALPPAPQVASPPPPAVAARPPAIYQPAPVAPPSIPAPPPAKLAVPPAPPPPPVRLPPVAKPVEPARAAPPISLSPNNAKDDADAPVGDWQTESKGWVRITKCGKALCGYVLSSSSNDQGEVVLVNMKLTNEEQWSGSVYSQSSGDTYYGTMEMKGPNRLRVEACALGRFYCAGNNWSRINAKIESLITSRPTAAEPRS
jgi:uncharacterized protein (DUF2147 family)